ALPGRRPPDRGDDQRGLPPGQHPPARSRRRPLPVEGRVLPGRGAHPARLRAAGLEAERQHGGPRGPSAGPAAGELWGLPRRDSRGRPRPGLQARQRRPQAVAGGQGGGDPGQGGSRGPGARSFPARPHARAGPDRGPGVRPRHQSHRLRQPRPERDEPPYGLAAEGDGLLGHARPRRLRRRGDQGPRVRGGGGALILVTGGAGFIGSAVVRRLLREGHAVRVVDDLSKGVAANIPEGSEYLSGDLTDREVARRAFDGVDLCFHLAAKIGGIGYFHRYPADILDENNLMLSSVFRTATDAGSKVVYVSSSMVFERAGEFPTPEEAIDRWPPPFSAYGFSKLIGEWYCRAFHEQYGTPFAIARPFNA